MYATLISITKCPVKSKGLVVISSNKVRVSVRVIFRFGKCNCLCLLENHSLGDTFTVRISGHKWCWSWGEEQGDTLWFSYGVHLITFSSGHICMVLFRDQSRPFAWWRHFIRKTRVLCTNAFLCRFFARQGIRRWNDAAERHQKQCNEINVPC